MIGTGYVGLVTGTCFANAGHNVYCLDNDEQKIKKLKKGIMTIYEPRLEKLVSENIQKGTLHISNDTKKVVEMCDTIFIAVGTPPDEDGSADLKHVLEVAKNVGKYMNGDKVVVTKSTVPVGTADKVEETIIGVIKKRKMKYKVSVCSNPEFLKEGCAVDDFNKPDRIIVGTRDGDEKAKNTMIECYAPFSRNREKIIFMDVRSSELTKYAANAMLATKISFINEIARIAEKMGADIESVRSGIGSDTRIGYQFIYAGAGYGGSCFPKDVQALIQTANKKGINTQLLNAVEQVNEEQKKMLFQKLQKNIKGEIKNKSIAVWGLAFKPNTDDMRNAVSIILINEIIKNNGNVRGFDPIAAEEAKKIFGKNKNFKLCEERYETINNADALVICTEWNEFRIIDFETLKKKMNNPLIIDGRNIVDKKKARENGVKYIGIGR